MNEFSSQPDSSEAELCGLPQRLGSSGRDPLEEIASEYLDLLRSGQGPGIEQLVKLHPGLENELREFLPLVAAMEDWKSNQELKAVKPPLPERFELERLGDYRILREIARGGMGVVFEAEQEPIGRRVAVKLLPWRFPSTSRWGQQFQREARTAARLQHARIVPVFSFGEHEGHFYYVMQLIEGVGLDTLIDRWKTGDGTVLIEELVREFHPLEPGREGPQENPRLRRVLRRDAWQQLGKIAAQIAGALRYAHRQGVLHRDIKPANLLIDWRGNVWIADFGLALGRDRAISGENEPLMGTLRYMAPEQFAGEVDERSDIFSFGVTLFELCTLQPAFRSRTKQSLLKEVQRAEVLPPRSINPDIPGSLEAIILKAVARDPDRRYQSADELHAALLQFLNGAARPENRLWRRIRNWF